MAQRYINTRWFNRNTRDCGTKQKILKDNKMIQNTMK